MFEHAIDQFHDRLTRKRRNPNARHFAMAGVKYVQDGTIPARQHYKQATLSLGAH